MGVFAIKRIIQAVPTLIGLTLVSFLLVHIVPGGPAQAMLGPKATPARVAAINREFGLNKPLYIQYYHWFVQLLHGNLGVSYFYNQTVSQLFAIDLPRTLAIVMAISNNRRRPSPATASGSNDPNPTSI